MLQQNLLQLVLRDPLSLTQAWHRHKRAALWSGFGFKWVGSFFGTCVRLEGTAAATDQAGCQSLHPSAESQASKRESKHGQTFQLSLEFEKEGLGHD